MAFSGSCHCGKLSYTVNEDLPTKAMECNCSICRRRGALHHFTTPDKFSFRGSQSDIHVYQWNKQIIRFEFCVECGCAPFARGLGPDGPMVEINLRCADDLDTSTLQIETFDGAHRL